MTQEAGEAGEAGQKWSTGIRGSTMVRSAGSLRDSTRWASMSETKVTAGPEATAFDATMRGRM